MGSCCSKPTNEFYDGIWELNTRHRRDMNRRKKYLISVYKDQLIAGHHAIVISDGENKDITFEITVTGGKTSALSGQERAVAKVAIFESNKRKDLKYTEETQCTLYQLAETAARILDDHCQFNVVSNNCQKFCNKFLERNGLPTYTTDDEILTAAANKVARTVASAVTSCFQAPEFTATSNLSGSNSQQ